MLPRDPELRADAYERAGNLASIRSVPDAILSDGPARQALMDSAAAGEDTYCYWSGGTVIGTPCCWYGGARYALADWPAVYAERQRRQQAKGGAR